MRTRLRGLITGTASAQLAPGFYLSQEIRSNLAPSARPKRRCPRLPRAGVPGLPDRREWPVWTAAQMRAAVEYLLEAGPAVTESRSARRQQRVSAGLSARTPSPTRHLLNVRVKKLHYHPRAWAAMRELARQTAGCEV